jgi:hypothetical protein
VAYSFWARTLGLLGGIGTDQPLLPIGLMVLVMTVVYVGDHPRFSGRSSQQVVVLDRAVADPARGPGVHLVRLHRLVDGQQPGADPDLPGS